MLVVVNYIYIMLVGYTLINKYVQNKCHTSHSFFLHLLKRGQSYNFIKTIMTNNIIFRVKPPINKLDSILNTAHIIS